MATSAAFLRTAFLPAAFLTVGSNDVIVAINGVDVLARISGLTIDDALNDAPNSCSLRIEGTAPQVDQSIRITVGFVVLFAGVIQSVDMDYDGTPDEPVWACQGIDDTAKANFLRPFGSWTATSATAVAQSIAASFAPTFDDSGIVASLPAITITFDGSETFIACLARIAKLIGGYCKVEDGIIYLFLTDSTNPPDDLDSAGMVLNVPSMTRNVDVSQLRTRVYGKGYGETIVSDVSASETILPIQNGAQFTNSGGKAITGVTPDGAQFQVIQYAGVLLSVGGTLVGPGAQPPNAPTLTLAAGAGVTAGVHDVGVVFVTAAGRTLPSPYAQLDVGFLAPPTVALTANAATTGTGPDQGSHDYKVTNVGLGGETTPSSASNAITTSAASGQLSAPGAPSGTQTAGSGIDDGTHKYVVTLVNSAGETEAGTASASVTAGLGNLVNPSGAGVFNGSAAPTTGGSLTPSSIYEYVSTQVTASGETTSTPWNLVFTLGASDNACSVGFQYSSDSRVTHIRFYRRRNGGTAERLATVANVVGSGTSAYFDTASDASISGNPAPPSANTAGDPYNQIQLSSIPLGATGTTARKLYRQFNGSGTYKLVTTLSDNATTSYLDTKANSALGADAPAVNTTGTAVQVIPLTNIPLGPNGTTSRKLYRRFNGSGTFKLVATIGNNTATTYSDTTANAGLGADAPSSNTAAGNQIALSAIPTGAAMVTAREIYMSPAGGGTKRLCLTIADNSTTTGTVTMSDATLAGQAAAPTSDTSGLAQATGQVNPGATTVPLASSAPFASGGGWATLGGQTVRYASVSGQTLTGIPASGPGSIVTAILYGQQALPTPSLTGVTGLSLGMASGSSVHIWVQRDDAAAQAAQAARAGSGNGIVEYTLFDERRAEASLTALCDASLAQFSYPIVTVSYATRDVKTKSGKTIVIDMTLPFIQEELTIQQVTIDQIGAAQGLMPRFSVVASSVRFSFEDTLRRLVSSSAVQ